jgi:hypothetical protein
MSNLTNVTAGASVLILFIGYFGIYRPQESAIAMRSTQLIEARTLVEVRRLDEQRGPELRREQNIIARELQIAGVTERPTIVVERFLRVVQHLAGTRRLSILGIVGTGVANPAAIISPASAQSVGATLQEVPFDVTIRGNYASLLDLVQQLGDVDLPARVAITSITSDQAGTPGSHELTANLHVILECIASEQRLVHRPA